MVALNPNAMNGASAKAGLFIDSRKKSDMKLLHDSTEIGVITDALATPYKVLSRARVRAGETVAVFGAGAWGTALALAWSSRHSVSLWTWQASHAAAMTATRENAEFLPG